MHQPVIKNAKIVSTELGYEDHGIPTFFLHLDYGDSRQGFGGYIITNHDAFKIIFGILETLGVRCWEDLTGVYVRARVENGLVKAISPILKEKWFFVDSQIDIG